MNEATYLTPIIRLGYRLMLLTRYIGINRICRAFFNSNDDQIEAIQRVYVINLDRHDYRWCQIKRELKNLYDVSGEPLTSMTRRFSAVDARYYKGQPDNAEIKTDYSLADQLYVDPNPLSNSEIESTAQHVEMTRQEIAIALSHIRIWRLIAEGKQLYTLVLEDDVIFRRFFSKHLNKVWIELMDMRRASEDFDVLYLSYKEAQMGAKKCDVSKELFRPESGLWQLSGYVLSRKGAKKLLSLLPVQGPIDLWINLQFQNLNVVATRKSLIKQRLDFSSSNSYSILPILSKVGLHSREKPLLYRKQILPFPVIALGENGTGLTSLAMALSILGFRCCSDLIELPVNELECLFSKKNSKIFDAYVNIGSFTIPKIIKLARLYKNAYFIITVQDDSAESVSGDIFPKSECNSGKFEDLVNEIRKYSKVLILPDNAGDKWELLCKFLGREYPSASYPIYEDEGQRDQVLINDSKATNVKLVFKKLKRDYAPWIVTQKGWYGIRLKEVREEVINDKEILKMSKPLNCIDSDIWSLRNDTFPSNLALFKPSNFSIEQNNFARLTLKQENSSVRGYTSGAICSQRFYKYGWFQAVLKPAKVSGLITGIFLHRDSPRQEIDIELLGKDTTKMLVNVFYNPGSEGAKLEYGYRGTPVIIDLGFDAAKDFHSYAIKWGKRAIRWYVDNKLIYERVNWDPTPIPHLPMQFNVNLWHSRSVELAGKLAHSALPASTEINSININAQRK